MEDLAGVLPCIASAAAGEPTFTFPSTHQQYPRWQEPGLPRVAISSRRLSLWHWQLGKHSLLEPPAEGTPGSLELDLTHLSFERRTEHRASGEAAGQGSHPEPHHAAIRDTAPTALHGWRRGLETRTAAGSMAEEEETEGI